MQMASAPTFSTQQDWRQIHLGRLLGHAMRRFDARVLHLMAHNVDVPLALSNLAARAQVSAAHIHITRHLSLQGSRLSELAESAGMTKQAMGDLVTQCEAWGLVQRTPDPQDGERDVLCSPKQASLGCARSRKRWRKPKQNSNKKWASTSPPW